ncbi:MAG: hypothetical protein APR63_10660 [Desulfuromonas sp. SDB]|nr:MAG: hypothetical protein APR63_10660 [Desulfuromonas sp. SDB]
MYILSTSQMKKADQYTIDNLGIPSLVLMETAGRSVAYRVIENYTVDNETVLLISGKGNNGGDGMVAARYLHQAGVNIEIVILAKPEDLSPDCKKQLDIINKLKITPHFVTSEDDLNQLDTIIQHSQLIIDAIFGTGLKGSLSSFYKHIISAINNSCIPLVSVDIPSGINGDSGQIVDQAVTADITITFGAIKPGHFKIPGRMHSGNIWVTDISIPAEIIAEMSEYQLITYDLVFPLVNNRDPLGHKGSFGKILIVGGCKGMTGAPSLAAAAAYRSGAGLVTLALPQEILSSAQFCPEAVSIELNQGGYFNQRGADKIIEIQKQYDALIIGPGLGRAEETQQAVVKLLEHLEIPAVVDADGLYPLSDNPDLINGKTIVLTPHWGEMSGLTGLTIDEIRTHPWETAAEFAKKHKVTVHLKGPLGQVADGANAKMFISPFIENSLATAGSGDVLSGIMGSFLAGNFSTARSACAAVFIHGLSGRFAGQEYSSTSVTSLDLIDFIPSAICSILEQDQESFFNLC